MAQLAICLASAIVIVACEGSPFRSQPPSDGLHAKGGKNAFFALKEGRCSDGTYETPTGPRFLRYEWPQPRGSAFYPSFVIDGYHGVGTYQAAWPTVTGRNTRMELHEGAGLWMADTGTITVTADDATHFQGVLATQGMKPFPPPPGQSPPGNTATVDLTGSWRCTLGGNSTS